jgi:hypothetical protein
VLHWTLDTTNQRTYSLDPAPRLTIQGFSCFRLTAGHFNSTKCSGWSMTILPCVVEALAESELAVIPEASLQACLKISKLFIAYLEGFVPIFLCSYRLPVRRARRWKDQDDAAAACLVPLINFFPHNFRLFPTIFIYLPDPYKFFPDPPKFSCANSMFRWHKHHKHVVPALQCMATQH